VSAQGEEAFVAWLRRKLPKPSLVGDDTAELVLPGKPGRLVATVDQQIEGTHFLPGLDPRLVGRRLLRVNLSDLAASGARPRWALLALGLPAEQDPRRIVEGVLQDARRFGIALAGGDIAHADELTASLTLIGEKRRGDASLGRDRARPGHAIWAGGTIGESALGCELLVRGAGLHGRKVDLSSLEESKLPARLLPAARRAVLRNLLPEPQLELGRWLARLGKRAGAAIDLSDGLGKDLGRVCTASDVGAEIDLRLLRRATPPRFDELAAAVELDSLAVALAGGEDYVLLFTLPEPISPPARFGAKRIGRITRERALSLLDRAGDRHDLPQIGWDHLLPE